jgi:hypothetical protein
MNTIKIKNMETSDFQQRVINAILQREVEEITAALTDNENAVIVTAGEHDAAFTADEARKLAETISVESEDWDRNVEDVVVYLQNLADIVDGEKSVEEIKHMWKDRKLNPDYE